MLPGDCRHELLTRLRRVMARGDANEAIELLDEALRATWAQAVGEWRHAYPPGAQASKSESALIDRWIMRSTGEVSPVESRQTASPPAPGPGTKEGA